MVEALQSDPKPTWYSSVPTIHNATVAFLLDNADKYGVKDGVWKGHGLRMIRSGAAALLAPDGAALGKMYGTPIFPTYSMSEQMPISQPPHGMLDQLNEKPGSVGVPVAATCAIVSAKTLQPLPFGQEGEISISGPTVLTNYYANKDADRKNYFHVSGIGADHKSDKFFLTGDVGVLDAEGFLSLKGRAKELIKKGGEQVSPYEVEEPLTKHPFVRVAVCFAVTNKAYGEEVGCAIVLSPEAPAALDQRSLIKELRAWLKDEQLAPLKFPTKWKVVDDADLPKTKTKKYIRIGLSDVLGFEVRTAGRSISPPWRPIRIRRAPRTYAPWGCIVRVVSQTKSRKRPTRNVLPPFLFIRPRRGPAGPRPTRCRRPSRWWTTRRCPASVSSCRPWLC